MSMVVAREVIRGRADHVEPAEPFDAAVGRRPHGLHVANIDDLGDDPATHVGDQPRRLVEIPRRGGRDDDRVHRTADVEGDDVGALLREPHHLRAPDPPGRAGDQRDLAVEPSLRHAFWVRPASTTS
jgi:hypothetical protein